MIIRIATEGQYRLKSAHLDDLNDVDEQIMTAVSNDNREQYQILFDQLLEIVRTNGTPLAEDELLESAMVLPPPDTTFEEARKLFVGDGVIPAEL
ncbi:MAG: hypothetical protein WD401_04355 [Thermomicrobiaceae bacterium]